MDIDALYAAQVTLEATTGDGDGMAPALTPVDRLLQTSGMDALCAAAAAQRMPRGLTTPQRRALRLVVTEFRKKRFAKANTHEKKSVRSVARKSKLGEAWIWAFQRAIVKPNQILYRSANKLRSGRAQLRRLVRKHGAKLERKPRMTAGHLEVIEARVASRLKKRRFKLEARAIARRLTLMMANGIDYENGLSETNKSMINKMLTDMTSSGKTSEALAKKIEELSDLLKS